MQVGARLGVLLAQDLTVGVGATHQVSALVRHDDIDQYIRAWERLGNDREKFRDAVPLSLIHISEPTRLLSISYAVFCLKKKKPKGQKHQNITCLIKTSIENKRLNTK